MKKSTKIIWSAAIASLMLTACPAYGPGPEDVICYYGPGPDIQDNSGDYIEQIAQDNNQIRMPFGEMADSRDSETSSE